MKGQRQVQAAVKTDDAFAFSVKIITRKTSLNFNLASLQYFKGA